MFSVIKNFPSLNVTKIVTFFSNQGPILDCCWHDDGTKVFMASCDKQVRIEQML